MTDMNKNDLGFLGKRRRFMNKCSSSQSIRRSTRKRSLPFATGCTASSAKRSKKSTRTPSPTAPTLTTLPYYVTESLLLYLDVDTLENLSATCTYFDQLLAGRFPLSISFPFPEDFPGPNPGFYRFNPDFLAELKASSNVEKKPLLKIRCDKAGRVLGNFCRVSRGISREYFSKRALEEISDYLVSSQLALLSTDQLREVDLVPAGFSNFGEFEFDNCYTLFTSKLLGQLERLGSLSNLTRLDVMVGQHFSLAHFITQMPTLIELGLNILTKPRMSKREFISEYLPRLEMFVAVSKAPVLKLNGKLELRCYPLKKVLKNKYVEKLVVTGPCNFNIFPIMEKLKEVVVEIVPGPEFNCSYLKSKLDDKSLHRHGLCCVNIGAVFEHCPKVEKFMGVEIGSVSQDKTFAKWNAEVRKKFHKNYLDQGGSMELKDWAKARWYSGRPDLSAPRAGVMHGLGQLYDLGQLW